MFQDNEGSFICVKCKTQRPVFFGHKESNQFVCDRCPTELFFSTNLPMFQGTIDLRDPETAKAVSSSIAFGVFRLTIINKLGKAAHVNVSVHTNDSEALSSRTEVVIESSDRQRSTHLDVRGHINDNGENFRFWKGLPNPVPPRK